MPDVRLSFKGRVYMTTPGLHTRHYQCVIASIAATIIAWELTPRAVL